MRYIVHIVYLLPIYSVIKMVKYGPGISCSHHILDPPKKALNTFQKANNSISNHRAMSGVTNNKMRLLRSLIGKN